MKERTAFLGKLDGIGGVWMVVTPPGDHEPGRRIKKTPGDQFAMRSGDMEAVVGFLLQILTGAT